METLDDDFLIGPAAIHETLVDDGRHVPARGRFGAFVSLERRSAKLTVEQFAQELEVSPDELHRIEADPEYVPRPRTVLRLATFAGVPVVSMAKLSGVAREGELKLSDRAFRYAARSDDIMSLSAEENAVLSEFVSFLKSSESRI
jgi:transcriptional regulator with XRE-family HTH domain